MDCKGHLVTDSEDCTECVCPRSHVGNRSQIFERGILFLERVSHWVALSVDFDFAGLDFNALSASDRLHKVSAHTDSGASRNLCKKRLLECRLVHYNLYIIYSRTVIEGDECHILISSLCPYPALDCYFPACFAFEQVFDFDSFFHLRLLFCGLIQPEFSL